METKILSISKLKELISEIFYNKQDIVTKISDNSVINSIFYGVAKVGQKALVDIANVEGQLFPEFATSTYLDNIAERSGVPARLSASGSSVFLRLVGSPGTKYMSATQTFINTNGVAFELAQNVTVGEEGYIYANVRSKDVGKKTNVDPHTITKVTPIPSGHTYLINEFKAIGGFDSEDDQRFRQRIMNYPNILSENTLEKLNQIFISINQNVLRTIYKGLGATGKNKLGVLTQNGVELSNSELDDLLSNSEKYISISDLRKFGNNINGVTLVNVDYFPIDIDFRADLIQNYDPDLLRIDLQTKFAREVDYRFWEDGDSVQWDNLLQIVKSTQGVRSVPDKRFFPQSDVEIPSGSFPRFRSFIMRDLEGNILVDQQGNLDPVFFSNTIQGINQIL